MRHLLFVLTTCLCVSVSAQVPELPWQTDPETYGGFVKDPEFEPVDPVSGVAGEPEWRRAAEANVGHLQSEVSDWSEEGGAYEEWANEHTRLSLWHENLVTLAALEGRYDVLDMLVGGTHYDVPMNPYDPDTEPPENPSVARLLQVSQFWLGWANICNAGAKSATDAAMQHLLVGAAISPLDVDARMQAWRAAWDDCNDAYAYLVQRAYSAQLMQVAQIEADSLLYDAETELGGVDGDE